MSNIVTRRVEHVGMSGFGITPPTVHGYRCFFVARVGGSHTTFTYKPE